MKVTPQAIPEVLLIEPKRFGDARGFFSEVWKRSALAAQGFAVDFVQDNHSFSRDVGVLRGLHFQRPPTPQGKLVRVVRGRILDVAVDIREGSPTYGQHVTAELSAENWAQLWVPRGFAHGFVTLEPDTEVLYKVDGEYDPATDAGIAWDDPALGIAWPIPPGGVTLSDKDRKAPRLADIPPPFPQGSL
ncbi:MAG: dTDP-4-dehydrorhamnose 3,5-epimerase [Roseococcus sp.]|nr:dTDP-4-dehydrorhamnose 3,5-epimerase [Roseococcus sp.]